MKTITITTDDATYNQLLNAVLTTTGYQSQIADPQNPGKVINNPTTQDQQVQKVISQYLTSFMANFLARQASVKAQADAKNTLPSAITVTSN